MIPPALASQILSLRAQANAQTVPSGMLAWWGRVDFPQGLPSDATLSQAHWEDWYMRLQQAELVPESVEPLFRVKAKTVALRPDGPLPIAIANYRIAVLQPEIRNRVHAAALAGLALDPPPLPLAEVIEERRVFFASSLLHDQWARVAPTYRGRSITFLLDSQFYFANPGDVLPEQIELDPGDGQGFRTLRFGDTLSAHYDASEPVRVTVRCPTANGQLEASFTVLREIRACAPRPDETWPLRAPNGSTGKAYIYRAAGERRSLQALVLAEGFPGSYPYDYLYDIVNQHDLLEELRGIGYDVILLGFDNGADYIQNNAEVVVSCIEQILTQTERPLVVGGMSMGGLVSRYALAAMEARGQPHNASVFLTIDTPHQGAYTSLSVQWFAHYFAESSPQAALLSLALDSPANQQFVTACVKGGTAKASPLREQFLSDLEGIGGYPKSPRRLAVACGSGTGRRTLAPYQPSLEWMGSPFASALLWALPEGSGTPQVVASGYSLLADPGTPAELAVSSEISWEGAPGGQNIYNTDSAAVASYLGYGAPQNRIPVSCAVPTVSALDLAINPFEPIPEPGSSPCPFQDYICCQENQQHLQFTPEVKRWILERLDLSCHL
ncbi:MAG: hypothetical protein ABSF50_14060 [Burkholderiaceae bacterium]|jgi:hypothetical protein